MDCHGPLSTYTETECLFKQRKRAKEKEVSLEVFALRIPRFALRISRDIYLPSSLASLTLTMEYRTELSMKENVYS
jgi:hypothetical protein